MKILNIKIRDYSVLRNIENNSEYKKRVNKKF